jgi:hypothetical protein
VELAAKLNVNGGHAGRIPKSRIPVNKTCQKPKRRGLNPRRLFERHVSASQDDRTSLLALLVVLETVDCDVGAELDLPGTGRAPGLPEDSGSSCR